MSVTSAPASIPSNLDPSVDTSLPSTFPVTVMFPVTPRVEPLNVKFELAPKSPELLNCISVLFPATFAPTTGFPPTRSFPKDPVPAAELETFPLIKSVPPSNVRLASAFIASAPVAVKTLLFEPFVMKSDTSTEIASAATSIPVPAPMSIVIAPVPPPESPEPAVTADTPPASASSTAILAARLCERELKEPLISDAALEPKVPLNIPPVKVSPLNTELIVENVILCL